MFYDPENILFLNGYLNTTVIARSTALQVGQEVGDIIPRMPVQTSP